ncbi:MAG: YihY/virulence factor BrkB family protein [Actinomycetota bacterium]|nr:YihY/virulence factor BrkB family protein [Actinomycetota bacterium]
MAVGRALLTPLVVLAAVARSRRRDAGARDPYPDEPAPRQSPARTGARDSGPDRLPDGRRLPPGGTAESPTQIPKAGWKQILKRAWKESNDDNVGLLAAGVAFYIFLALFPALIAAVTLYGLVADPAQVEQQIQSLSGTLPEESASLIGDQLRSIASTSSSALGFGLVASVLGALFSASGGVQNLMKAINLAYDEDETRGFVKLRGTALLLTLGAVLFIVVAVGLIAVTPVLLNALGLGAAVGIAVNVGRWIGLVAFVMVALSVLYRYAPDRDNAKFQWVGIGSMVATVVWIIGSAGFSLYVSNFGSYGKTYGALAGVVVLLLWLYLTSYIILLGAEVNAEAERQTAKDTTEGPDQPMGERGATSADTVVTA